MYADIRQMGTLKDKEAASSDNFPIDMRVSTDLMNKGGKKKMCIRDRRCTCQAQRDVHLGQHEMYISSIQSLLFQEKK